MSSQLFTASSPTFGKNASSYNNGAAGANGASGGISAAAFKVSTAVGTLYSKLPPKLQNQVAYRHFYTDLLDKSSSNLSTKFFSLVILYFCSIFKLQGRRMQYKANESEKSGRDFAKAHRRSRSIFRKLTACYGTILMRYTTNSVLVYEKKGKHLHDPKASQHGGLHTGHHLKNPLPQVHRTPAFVYVSDEMVFYEHLFQITVQIVKLAFNGDESLQSLAENETNKLFRSNSFLFKDKKREEAVRKAATQLDRQSDHLMLNNAKELAALLTPPVEPLVMKYANQQRSPFMNTQFPGGTNHIRYQRPKRDDVLDDESQRASRNEAAYTVEVRHADFPRGHRALVVFEAAMQERKFASIARQREARKSDFGNNNTSTTSSTQRVSRLSGKKGTTPAGAANRSLKDMLAGLPNYDDATKFDGTAESLIKPQEHEEYDDDEEGGEAGETITTSITVNNEDKSLVSEKGVPAGRLHGTTRRVIHANRLTSLQPDMISEPSPAFAGSAGSALRDTDGDDRFLRILNMPDEKWINYDLFREIDSIYQSLANGVEVSSFSIPEDILLDYGEDGILIVERE